MRTIRKTLSSSVQSMMIHPELLNDVQSRITRDVHGVLLLAEPWSFRQPWTCLKGWGFRASSRMLSRSMQGSLLAPSKVWFTSRVWHNRKKGQFDTTDLRVESNLSKKHIYLYQCDLVCKTKHNRPLFEDFHWSHLISIPKARISFSV